MLRAAVPKTTVDEDRNLQLGEDHISSAAPVEWQGIVDSVPQAAGMQQFSDPDLGGRVSLPISLHGSTDGVATGPRNTLRRCLRARGALRRDHGTNDATNCVAAAAGM